MAIKDQNEQSLLQDVDRIANSLEKIATSLETLVARDRLTEPLGEIFSEEEEDINEQLNKVLEETDDPMKVVEYYDQLKAAEKADQADDDETEKAPQSPQEKEERIAVTQEVIKEKRAQGKTWPWIAEFLNDNDHPTISGKGKWHRQSVAALVKDIEE